MQTPDLPRGYSNPTAKKSRVQKLKTVHCGEVDMIELDIVTHDATKTTLQPGTMFTVQSKDSGAVQVCVLLPCTLNTSVFVICVARCVDDQNKVVCGYPSSQEADDAFAATEWGLSMLSNVARFHHDKCNGCPQVEASKATYNKAESALTLSSWKTTGMQVRMRAGGAGFRESRVAEDFWQSIVSYNGKVTKGVAKFAQSNMHSGKGAGVDPAEDASKKYTLQVAPRAPRAPGKRGTREQANIDVDLTASEGADPAKDFQGANPQDKPQLPLPGIPALQPTGHGYFPTQLPFPVIPGSHALQPAGHGSFPTQTSTYATDFIAMASAANNLWQQQLQSRDASPKDDISKLLMTEQSKQVAKMQDGIAKMQDGLLDSLKMSISQGTRNGDPNRVHIAPTATTAHAAPATAPAPEPEDEVAAWLKANKIMFTPLVLTKVKEMGVESGDQLLLLDQEDWRECGFLKLPLIVLQKLKKAAEAKG
jgi:hypothetical protein